MTPAYDIIVMAGQSNSQGSGEGPVSTPYVPNEKVLYMHPDFTIVQACEEVRDGKTIGNFSLSFAQRYLEEGLLKSGRKLLILQTAVGGTGFSDNHWNPGDILYERMVNMISAALSLNENNRIVAFLWHQGETDALNRVSYETHYANLSRFLTSLKGAFDLKDVPLIAGDFVPHFRDANSEICTPVIKAIRELFEAEKNGAFVSSDRLLSNKQAIGIEDTIHFSRDSLYKLGNRYFDAYKQIITK